MSGTVVVSLAEGLLKETVILYPQSNLLFSRSKWFMCRDNSSVILKQNLHDFPVFLTGKVMISIRPPMNWVFPMAHKFWNCNFRVFSLNCGSYFFYSQMFKRLKFDCHFFCDFMCMLEMTISFFGVGVKFASSIEPFVFHAIKHWQSSTTRCTIWFDNSPICSWLIWWQSGIITICTRIAEIHIYWNFTYLLILQNHYW